MYTYERSEDYNETFSRVRRTLLNILLYNTVKEKKYLFYTRARASIVFRLKRRRNKITVDRGFLFKKKKNFFLKKLLSSYDDDRRAFLSPFHVNDDDRPSGMRV